MKLFPNYFQIEGTGGKIKVFPAKQAERIMVVGASSSTDPAPFRMPVVGRAPYRTIPNDQIVEFSVRNPARPGSARFRRYGIYSRGANAGEARRLGMTSQDLKLDLAAGAITFR